jgi:hypothetical protein
MWQAEQRPINVMVEAPVEQVGHPLMIMRATSQRANLSSALRK